MPKLRKALQLVQGDEIVKLAQISIQSDKILN